MARKAHCPACGLSFIKGRMVVRLIGTEAVRQRVCKTCAALAVPVLASDAQARCQECGKNLARYCGGCVGKAMEVATGKSYPDAMAAAAIAKGAKTRKERR
jgi:hypothetical protein